MGRGGAPITVSRLAHLLAFGLVVISVVANIAFGYLLTSGPERFLYSAAFGLLDTFKSLLPILAAAAFAAGQVGKGRVTVALFLIFSVLSFSAEIGLYATTTGMEAGGGRAAHAAYENAVAEKRALESRLMGLGTTRPAADVEADIAAAKLDKAFSRSSECTAVTVEPSRILCAGLARLKGELARSQQADDLRHRIDAAGGRLGRMSRPETFAPVDPQAEILGRLAAISPETVRTILAVLIALLIEAGSGLGPWLASGHRAVSAAQPPAPVAKLEPVARPAPRCHIESWLEEGVTRRKGSHVTAAEMLDAYRTWCAVHTQKPIAQTALGVKLKDLGYGKAKVGGRMRYVDVALKPTNAGVKLVASRW